jgi:hypothetical protein
MSGTVEELQQQLTEQHRWVEQLQDLLSQQGRVILILIDALDELSPESERNRQLEPLRKLVGQGLEGASAMSVTRFLTTTVGKEDHLRMLAARQGIRPRTLRDLRDNPPDDPFESDEEREAFLEGIYAARREQST